MMRLIKGNPFQVTERPVPPAIQATSNGSSTSTSPGTCSTSTT
jgi:hypothetical protein